MTLTGMLQTQPEIEVLEYAKVAFSVALGRSMSATNYLTRCGISKETCEQYSLGVCDIKAFSSLLNFSDQELARAGLISEEKNAEPLFNNSIMMPVFNPSLITIGFLALPIPNKREKSTDYQLAFHRDIDTSNLFFGLNIERENRKKESLIVSSPMEVLCLHSMGFESSFSPLNNEITEMFVDNIFMLSNDIHFVLPSLPAKSYIAKQALDSSMRCVGRCVGKSVLFSFVPRRFRHCNAFLLKEGSNAFHRLLDKRRNIPELIFRKVGLDAISAMNKDEIKALCDAEFSPICNTELKDEFYKCFIKLARLNNDTDNNSNKTIANGAQDSKVNVAGNRNLKSEHSVPIWVNNLLVSDRYKQQTKRIGRKAPGDSKVSIALSAICLNGGRMPIRLKKCQTR